MFVQIKENLSFYQNNIFAIVQHTNRKPFTFILVVKGETYRNCVVCVRDLNGALL